MSHELPHRTYTLAQAAEELHLAPETIKETLDAMGISSEGEISEADINRVMDKLNGPDEAKLT